MIARSVATRVLGLVLAGGRSRRFGADKAVALLDGRSLIERVAERAAPQVDFIVINRNEPWPCGFSPPYSVLMDEEPSEGPLSGVLAGLAYGSERGYSHLATFSCDAPFFPHDCVARLMAASIDSTASVFVARQDGTLHPTFALMRSDCAPVLASAFANGLRSLHGMIRVASAVEVQFPRTSEGPDGDAFFNINTVNDMERAEHWLSQDKH